MQLRRNACANTCSRICLMPHMEIPWRLTAIGAAIHMAGIEKTALFEIPGVMLLNPREPITLSTMGGKNIELKIHNYLCVINIRDVERVFLQLRRMICVRLILTWLKMFPFKAYKNMCVILTFHNFNCWMKDILGWRCFY